MGQAWIAPLAWTAEEAGHDNAEDDGARVGFDGGGGGALDCAYGFLGLDAEDMASASDNPSPPSEFPDLSLLPPELALEVLSKLNATDLCLASCVWQQLASDEALWQGLCREQWPQASIYSDSGRARNVSFKRLYLRLDEGTLTFNSDPLKGMSYFLDCGLVADKPDVIAKFFLSTRSLSRRQVRRYLQSRQDVLDCMVSMQDFRGQFLPNALRKCFSKLEAPNERGQYLQRLLAAFSERFCQCNPGLGLSVDSVYVLCFSLILLSVDLTSPHVKNKMSKREFIRNTRNAVALEDRADNNNNAGGGNRGASNSSDLFGELYDNVFLRGHVSGEGKLPGPKSLCSQRQFVPGYLALFL